MQDLEVSMISKTVSWQRCRNHNADLELYAEREVVIALVSMTIEHVELLQAMLWEEGGAATTLKAGALKIYKAPECLLSKV